jgi:hypothetical protein
MKVQSVDSVPKFLPKIHVVELSMIEAYEICLSVRDFAAAQKILEWMLAHIAE